VQPIAAEAAALAEGLGEALDLEWAMDADGTLWWLQARPITAATCPPDYVISRSCADADEGPVTLWSNWNVRETMPDPMLPLTWTYWQEIVLPVAVSQVTGVSPASPLSRHIAPLDLVQGRIYFNMNAILAAPFIGLVMRRTLDVMDPEAGRYMVAMLEEGSLRPRRLPGHSLGRIIRAALAGARSLLRLSSALRPRRAFDILRADSEAVARRPPVDTLSNAQLVEEMGLWRRPECQRLLYGLQMEGVAIALFKLAQWVFRNHPRALERIATGIPANPTTQISIAIDGLTQAAEPLCDAFLEPQPPVLLLAELKEDGEGRKWLTELDDFLARFGHRGPMEFDLGAPRWRDDPAMIVELVRSGLRCPGEGIVVRLQRLRQQRTEAIAEAVAAAPWWRRLVMRSMARLVELYMPLREAPKHFGLHVFERARRAALEIGRRLVADDVLEHREQVFLLEWAELLELAAGQPPADDLHRRLAERDEQHRAFIDLPAPDFLRSDGVPVRDPRPQVGGDGELVGLPVAAGRVRGPVRVLRTPDPSSFTDGEVLVLRFADPGWTPIFPRAAALVVEVGGLMCHAAVVAREMGVPAVFGVTDATIALGDGDTVEVDGARGTVKVISTAG
jgi:pyruvate,water dikinase